MREFRLKQKRFKRLMNIFVIFSAVFIFAYIGASPLIVEQLGVDSQMVFAYICDGLVIGCMVLLFAYYTKYSKCDAPLEMVEYELADAGYYYFAREEKDTDSYTKAIIKDLRSSGYLVDENIEVDEFDVSVLGVKKSDMLYVIDVDNVDRNDLLAYLDCITYDVTVKYLKRKANVVILFVTDKAQEDAVALSKMITIHGKKAQIKIAFAIAEMSTGRCYFLGNKPTKCQQMIANIAMNCDVPIKDEYIGKERLACQDKLEEHMKSFDLKEFRNGTFLVH